MRKGTGFWQVASVLLLLPISAFASTLGLGLPGSGNGGDPTYDEGIVYTVGGSTIAGDVILCESTSPTCTTSTPTSDWSDVLVFFNSTIGPFVPDSSADADSAYVFSDDDSSGTFGGLANFLANYGGALSSNAQAVLENPNGPTTYGSYLINSPEGPSGAPEPGGFLLAGPILAGLAGLVRRRSFTKS